MSAEILEAMAASATLALRASLTPARHCQACAAELPYLVGRGRPRLGMITSSGPTVIIRFGPTPDGVMTF